MGRIIPYIMENKNMFETTNQIQKQRQKTSNKSKNIQWKSNISVQISNRSVLSGAISNHPQVLWTPGHCGYEQQIPPLPSRIFAFGDPWKSAIAPSIRNVHLLGRKQDFEKAKLETPASIASIASAEALPKVTAAADHLIVSQVEQSTQNPEDHTNQHVSWNSGTSAHKRNGLHIETLLVGPSA